MTTSEFNNKLGFWGKTKQNLINKSKNRQYEVERSKIWTTCTRCKLFQR